MNRSHPLKLAQEPSPHNVSRRMNLSELIFDINTLAEGYSQNTFSVSDVVTEALKRIREGDSKIWITVDTDKNLLAQANKIENSKSTDLPLYGIPFSISDNIDVENLPTTAACPDYKKFPKGDATVIAQLRAAGGIPIGKTNLDEFSTGLAGVNSSYGAPENPFDPSYIPGGSNSGSAVSVTLSQVSFSIGIDTIGASLIPASYNNLIALKPSRGLLSASGTIPAYRSQDSVSIISLNANDAQTVFRTAAAFDPTYPFSRVAPDFVKDASQASKEPSTFGIPDPTQLKFFENNSYLEAFLESIKRLEALGYEKHVIDFTPFLEAGRLFHNSPWVAERYLAIQDLIENAPEILQPSTRAIIETGRDFSAVNVFEAHYKMEALKHQANSAMSGLDFLVTPTAGTYYALSEFGEDSESLNSNLGYYTNFINTLDLSAIAVPTAVIESQTPFGVNLMAQTFQENNLLGVAVKLHQASNLPLGASDLKRAN